MIEKWCQIKIDLNSKKMREKGCQNLLSMRENRCQTRIVLYEKLLYLVKQENERKLIYITNEKNILVIID